MLDSTRRSLGSYFTPDDATAFMVEWALRGNGESWLEPSLGDGSFVRTANAYATRRGWEKPRVTAVELDRATAASAVEAGIVAPQSIRVADFLSERDIPPVDVVVGNPPYVRVRALNDELAASALQAAESTMGAPMDPAGSAWLPFVAKSTTHLKIGGRLALVLPLDFTYVRYARPLWDFLGRNYGRLQVLRFKDRVFPDLLQNVLVLLADRKGETTAHVDFYPLDKIPELSGPELFGGRELKINDIVRGERVFQRALLSTESREAYDALLSHSERSLKRAKFNIGYVSGHKGFFHPDQNSVERYSLPHESLQPTVVNSRQLKLGGLRTSTSSPENFLWLPTGKLTASEEEYVMHGEQEGVHLGYKCRIRRPWYVVPGVKIPDLLLTTFSDKPKLYINDGGWAASNSILAGTLRPGESATDFAASWYSALTLLSVELEIHSLGGGVMIAVPREADSVHVLKNSVIRNRDEESLNQALCSNEIDTAYASGDQSIVALVGRSGCNAIWEGIEALSNWRKSSHEPKSLKAV
nr:N-6 DNA methylase [Arthrobacter sp. zg-Y238]